MKIKTIITLTALFFYAAIQAAEPHVEQTIRDILENVRKLKTARPNAVPMAFWDCDGTLISGDISTGHSVNGRQVYSGMIVKAAEGGFSSILKDGAEAERFMTDKYPEIGNIGRWLSWPMLVQLFHGADAAALEAHCRRHAESVLKPWFFASSMDIMSALEKAGVENYVISGSPDIFVKAACTAIGSPRERIVGIRVRIAGGRVTTQIEYPLSMNEGKVECIREIINARPNAVAVAAFGNSYWTDGPFMRYVAVNRLPGGSKGVALMINGGEPPEEYKGLFRCVEQSKTMHRH